MKYRLAVHPKAIAQSREIYQYYQDIRPSLADRFDRELDACYRFIEQNPTGYQVRAREYRHAPVKGFRYRVVYAIREQIVVVYQVRHTSRKPSKKFGP
ncbi:MAG: type II toxin-antitoxin system RelE/ParE family toxin [Flavobacteriales bacterium]